jgi:RNA polymerase sigma-70 factor (ECF subfamily)
MPPHASSTAPLDCTSSRLLTRLRDGDSSALTQLIGRYLPRLQRWAHGRLPRWTRTIADTPDVIQDVMLRSLGRLDAVDLRGRHALAAYFREAVRNRIRDEHRQFAFRGANLAISDAIADTGPSPLDRAIERDLAARYRRALRRLRIKDQELIVGHLELDYSHEQLGHMTGRTRNAARMALQRALVRLAEEMREG